MFARSAFSQDSIKSHPLIVVMPMIINLYDQIPSFSLTSSIFRTPSATVIRYLGTAPHRRYRTHVNYLDLVNYKQSSRNCDLTEHSPHFHYSAALVKVCSDYFRAKNLESQLST